jgi:hypothetical protein
MDLRMVRRFMPLGVIATTFATGISLAPANDMKVSVSSSSVQLTGATTSQSESKVVSRSIETPDGTREMKQTTRRAVAGFRARVVNPNDGQLIGFVWSGAPDARLEVRTEDATGWSPWTAVESEDMPDPKVEAVRPGIGPIWVGAGAKTFDVRVVDGALDDLRLDSIHMNVSGRTSGIASAGAAVNMPSMISRPEWGAQTWGTGVPDCGSGPSVARAQLAVVHHTATSNSYSPSDSYGIVRAIQSFEMTSRGYCDLSYNFLVDRYGQIFEGRTNSIYQSVVGAHARGFNTGSVGVALIGQYQPGASPAVASVPTAQYDSLRNLLAWKMAWHGMDPLATVHTISQCSSADGYTNCRWPEGTPVALPAILGHRDVTKTSCPGDLVMALLPRLRAEVANQVVASGPFYPLPSERWQPDASGPGLLTLDAYGGLHPAGAAAAVSAPTYWPGWAIARDATGTTAGGYMLDGWGGVHPYGNAPPAGSGSPFWPGWDIARGIAQGPVQGSGYVLDGWGSAHPFGGAPLLLGAPYWPGWDIARDIVTLPGGGGGYVLDGWGGVHAFGSAPVPAQGPYWYGWDIARAIALNPDGPGGYVLDGFGGVSAFGGAPPLAVTNYTGEINHTGLAVLSGGRGYVSDANGNVYPLGIAPARSVSLTWTGFGIGRSVLATG